jgi:hypothetical protein
LPHTCDSRLSFSGTLSVCTRNRLAS